MRNPLLSTLLLAAVALPLGAQEPAPVAQGPATYTLRPGDILNITVWGREEYTGQFQVDEAGLLNYPVIGSVNVQDLTLAQVRDTVRAGLERLFANPFVTVTPLFRISVLGSVLNPGLYTVDPTLSIMEVVSLAGGPTPAGNVGKIRLYRGGTEQQVSFQRELLGGHSLHEVGIRSGDQVLVPRKFFSREDWQIVLSVANLALTIAIFANTLR
jgi:polysaccharide export outer membrane protein